MLITDIKKKLKVFLAIIRGRQKKGLTKKLEIIVVFLINENLICKFSAEIIYFLLENYDYF